jgi:hypothetical protein
MTGVMQGWGVKKAAGHQFVILAEFLPATFFTPSHNQRRTVIANEVKQSVD